MIIFDPQAESFGGRGKVFIRTKVVGCALGPANAIRIGGGRRGAVGGSDGRASGLEMEIGQDRVGMGFTRRGSTVRVPVSINCILASTSRGPINRLRFSTSGVVPACSANAAVQGLSPATAMLSSAW